MITLRDHQGADPVLRLPPVPPLPEREKAAAKARQERELVDHFFREMERAATGGMTRGIARLEIIEAEDVQGAVVDPYRFRKAELDAEVDRLRATLPGADARALGIFGADDDCA